MDVKVKICGITHVEDALAAVESGADALGLNFSPASPRFVTLERAAAIAQRLPPHVLRVGVFVDAAPDEIMVATRSCGLTMLQFHGSESPEFCTQFGVMSMKAIRIRDEASLEQAAAYPTDALLLDSYAPDKPGGSGLTFNWALAVEAKKFGKPIFLAGGLTPDNVAEAIRAVRPFGVDVASGVESAPGKKDAAKIRAFIAAARAA